MTITSLSWMASLLPLVMVAEEKAGLWPWPLPNTLNQATLVMPAVVSEL